MKTVNDWLDEYNISHRNPINKRLHWICVPLIVFAVACALKRVPMGPLPDLTLLVGVAVLLYYFRLSWRLALGMSLIFALAYALVLQAEAQLGAGLLWAAAAVFVLAWIGQFIGHYYERARPSFFKDLQFLLIGPLWLLAHVYRRLALPIQPATAGG